MNLWFENPKDHLIQLPGPDRSMVSFKPHHKVSLPPFFLKYCPKYLKAYKQEAKPTKPIVNTRSSRNNLKIKRNEHIKSKPVKPAKQSKIIKSVNFEIPTYENIGVGILSCNRLHCIKRILKSIKNNSDVDKLNLVISDESTDERVKEYLRSIEWIKLLDHSERRGVVHNSNDLMQALSPYKYKLLLNDDVEILKSGWETFYFEAMKSQFHHFCHRQSNLYGAKTDEGTKTKHDEWDVHTIQSKPQGAVLAFDDVAFSTAGYYDLAFPRYGMAHVDWSNRISLSGIQKPGFHDIGGSNEYFRTHNEHTVEEHKNRCLKEARDLYKKLSSKKGRIYIPLQKSYDIHVIINTYNRPHMLDLLLSDIEKNKSNYSVMVNIYDDGSEANYTKVLNKYDNINYKKYGNHGKKRYWELVNKSFYDAKYSNAKYFYKFDDDVKLVDDFFNKTIKIWNKIDDEKKICLNPLLDDLRKGQTVWGGTPKIVKFGNFKIWNSDWVDMMFMCEKNFFKSLDFEIQKISTSRWKKDPKKSSGVGVQISNRLRGQNLGMYQVCDSLIIHGDHDSAMNDELRKTEPIISCSKEPVTMSMASTVSRINVLRQVVDSVYGQCDELHIYLNDYNSVPKFLQRDRIICYSDLDDIGDIGKFHPPVKSGYRFTIDDDIIYPSNYVETMIKKIEQYGKKCCVGVHGVTLNWPITDYYKSRKCYHYRQLLRKDVGVHILGTGTLAFHSGTITIDRNDFEKPNMADIWLALIAQKQKVPLRCIARGKNWLTDAPGYNTQESICGTKSTANDQTAAIKLFNGWTIY